MCLQSSPSSIYLFIYTIREGLIMQTAKLFQNGQSQAVRLPKEFRFNGNEVMIKKVGNAVVLLPVENPWQSLFDSLNKFSADFMTKREQSKNQTRDDMFS
jgi:antitoxin VapB